ncbi:hypothetical protein NBRC116586_08970 [Pseudooceanicola nitratireducens]
MQVQWLFALLGQFDPGADQPWPLVGVDLVGAVGVGFEILNHNVVGGAKTKALLPDSSIGLRGRAHAVFIL